jgi:hypothetical protein
MRIAPKLLAAIALVLLSTACTGGIKKRINPPRASLQELAAQPNGQWRLTVRLQNFSNVPTRFASVSAKLTVGGQDAGTLVLTPDLSVGPETADAMTTTITPSLAAKVTVASALASGRAVRYTLNGRIVTSEPKGDTPFDYDSALNPAPGLNGVMR